MSSKLTGYALAVVAAATYGMNPLFTLPLYAHGMDAVSVLFFRYMMALPIIAVMMLARRRSFRLKRHNMVPALTMGVMMGLSSITLFLSYNYMDAGIASTMLFVYPLMVALIMSMLYHERMSGQTITCLALAMCGIAVLFFGADGGPLSLEGTLLVMVSSLTYAVYLVGVNRSGLRLLPTLTLTFYSLLAGWFVFAGKVLYDDSLTVPSQSWMWLDLFGLALLPSALSLLCTTAAIQRIGSTATAILGVFEPVTALILGVIVFGEVLSATSIAGIILIITSVTLVVAGGNLHPLLNRVRRMLPRRLSHRSR